MELSEVATLSGRILDEVERAVIGKRASLELVLVALLANGHVLLEDVPGLAKTLAARSFAQATGLDFTRVQFTPDLMPSDITGSSVFDQRSGDFEFRPGPVFTNLVLADEINRASPKTQAALLEAMQERQVSIDGTTHPLQPPFLVVATQNPVEYEGTYPLPEAQLDRFLLRVGFGYPDRAAEWEVLSRRIDRQRDEVTLSPIVDRPTLLAMQHALERVHVEESIGYYMVDLVNATRQHPSVQVGASPRGSLALVTAGRAKAVLSGRDFVAPEDVKAVAVAALGHRIVLKPAQWVRGVTGDAIVQEVLGQVPTPAPEDLAVSR
jgi:MoxR-like ATPase